MPLIPLIYGLSATALILATASTSSAADVTLGAPFQDHAVLQRDSPIAVWGTA
jgi:sialate O-acetylesterase